MSGIKAQPDWLKAMTGSAGVGVDRENSVIRGMVLAQEGPFKSEGRGEFDVPALKKIVSLANKQPKGLKSRLSHPTLSGDGIGKFLGRVKNPSLSSVRVMRDGHPTLLHAVRGDLCIDPTALDEPIGGGKPLGIYVMDLAESDPDALSSSLVLKADKMQRLDPKTKRPMMDEKTGDELPPLWMPTDLHASDIVDTGDAVDGILCAQLSAEGLPDELVRQASALLNGFLPGESRDVVSARLDAWLDRYLSMPFGDYVADIEEDGHKPLSERERLRMRLALLEAAG